MDYREAWELPVEIRKWWISRVQKEKATQKGSPHVDPFGRRHGT